MIQAVVKGKGGTVWTEFLGRRPASCTVDIFKGAGAQVVTTGACTVDTVNTTSTAATAAQDEAVALTSVAGITTGRRYLFGGEEVGIKSISGSTVTLWAPLAIVHAIGSTFQGLRVTYDVSALQAATVWSDGYATFTPDSGLPQTEVVHCTKHTFPDAMISAYDVRGIIPRMSGSVDADLDLEKAYRDARDNFLLDLGGKTMVNAIIGVAQFRQLVAMRFWLDRRPEFGENWAPEFDNVEKRYMAGLDRAQSVSPIDADGDGVTTEGPEKRALTGLDLEAL